MYAPLLSQPTTHPNTIHNRPPRRYPPPNPPPKYLKSSFDIIDSLLPTRAPYPAGGEYKRICRGWIGEFFLFAHRPFSPSPSSGEEWRRVGLPLIMILMTPRQVSQK